LRAGCCVIILLMSFMAGSCSPFAWGAVESVWGCSSWISDRGGAVARVVCVHGVGQQREAANTLHAAWAPALCGGVGLAGGRLPEAEVRCAFYGDLFRPPGRHLAAGDPLIRA
jgi:hypothetical protein